MPRESGASISIDELLKAYALGYFPMARSREEKHVVWVLPEERGIIPIDAIRISRSLKKFLKRSPFDVRINTAFARVISACADQTKTRDDTWINDAIIEAYIKLHDMGRAHSVECWQDEELVGGLYGIDMGAVFCGESMFSRATNASKTAMAHLMARLKIGGYQLIDAQFVNDHLVQFGLIGVSDDAYQGMLSAALAGRGDFSAAGERLSTARVLQSITQTS